jgi:hypothetical protein
MKKTLTILGFAACSTAALSQFTTFSNRATWAAAAGGTVLIEGFETAAPGALAAGVTHDLGLITFRVDLITATTSGASIAGAPAIAGVQDLAMNADDGMRTHIVQFDVGAVTAFGFDYEGAATGGLAVLIINGERFNFASTVGGAGFFGVVANAGSFDTVFFGDESPGSLPTEIFNSDEYSFVAVPEPGTLVAIGAGIALLALRRRK